MARGGFEPPKPQGRQIYSLLRLTTPQPRQITYQVGRRAVSAFRSIVSLEVVLEFWRSTCGPELEAIPMELAEGLEPPTR